MTDPQAPVRMALKYFIELNERYPEVERFAVSMLLELAANSHKGDQAAWRAASPETLLHDITWHWAKLAVALRELQDREDHRRHVTLGDYDRERWEETRVLVGQARAMVLEYCADVANLSMMLADRLDLLPETPNAVTHH